MLNSSSDFGFPHRNKPLGMYPAPAPFTRGSKFVDSRHPGKVFTVLAEGSSFGEPWLTDERGAWHDPYNCQVVGYLAPEEYDQRIQDRLLERLETAHNL